MATPFRAVVLCRLMLALVTNPDLALARSAKTSSQDAETWAAMVVTRITQADLKAGGGEQSGTVTVRMRISADGALDSAVVEGSSGSTKLDERALRAIQAASPFAPPPRRIITLEGYTELGFPLDLDSTSR